MDRWVGGWWWVGRGLVVFVAVFELEEKERKGKGRATGASDTHTTRIGFLFFLDLYYFFCCVISLSSPLHCRNCLHACTMHSFVRLSVFLFIYFSLVSLYLLYLSLHTHTHTS